MNCYYCDRIARADASYPVREAEFDTGSEAPRCVWHWRFTCDHCGEPGHFSSRFHCPRSNRLLCPAAGEVSLSAGRFWSFLDWLTLLCPDCGEKHPALDRAEHDGSHLWQVLPDAVGNRAWLSVETQLTRYPPHRWPEVDEGAVSDADIDQTWSENADLWDAGYDDRGDTNRRYSSDAVLLDFLSPVEGEYVLDAGSGTGYLARILARRGAQVKLRQMIRYI